MTMTAAVRRAGNPERRFYMAMILAMIATVLLGFARTFFLGPLFADVPSPHETFFYVHGVLFLAWMALLLLQGSLIATRNTALHMRLGVAAYVLVPAMIAMGVIGSLIAARRPGGFVGIPLPPEQFLTVVLGDMVMFAGFAGGALLYRREPQTHKRLILLACIVLMDPSIGRWPFAFIADHPMASFWLKDVFVAALALWDIATLRRIHKATLIGGLVILAEGLLRDPIGATPAWIAFAKWAMALLG